jgi:hypothetical protein
MGSASVVWDASAGPTTQVPAVNALGDCAHNAAMTNPPAAINVGMSSPLVITKGIVLRLAGRCRDATLKKG